MSITEITSTINMIDTVFQGETGVLASYIIRDKKTALVDPGPPVQATQIIQEFKHLGEKIDVLAVTHIHLDHSAGTWNILQKYPECKVFVHPRGARHLVDPTHLMEAALKQFKGEMPPYGRVNGVSSDAIIQSKDEMIIDLGDVQLQVIWTPGHSTHSQSFFEMENRVLFVGDAAGQVISDHVLPASPPPFNPDRTIESIHRMISLKPSIICISHFGYREAGLSHLEDFRNRVTLWKKLSFEILDDDGGLHDYYELICSSDQDIERLIQSFPGAKSDVYSSLVGFLSYAKWKKTNM
jgi:glyoxylase-like metal-dependent hydrolase (beta-lactamase superfamily II)